MSNVKLMRMVAYYSPGKGRRYLTARAAASAEAAAMLKAKYPDEDADYVDGQQVSSGWNWRMDGSLVKAHARLTRILLKRIRIDEKVMKK